MISFQALLLAGLGVTVALLIYLLIETEHLVERRVGKMLLLMGMVILPFGSASSGVSYGLEQSKKTSFCLSCHEMEPYGRSLHVDDEELMPAVHFQNRLVPRDEACYTCHKDYAMFGDIATKLNGLNHVWAHFFGAPKEKLELYEPYENRNCLSCHERARRYLKVKSHDTKEASHADLMSGKVSCQTRGCHDVAHVIDELEEADFWEEP